MTTQSTTTATETQTLTREMAQRVTGAWATEDPTLDHGQVWEQVRLIAASQPTTRAIGECLVVCGLGSPSTKVRID